MSRSLGVSALAVLATASRSGVDSGLALLNVDALAVGYSRLTFQRSPRRSETDREIKCCRHPVAGALQPDTKLNQPFEVCGPSHSLRYVSGLPNSESDPPPPQCSSRKVKGFDASTSAVAERAQARRFPRADAESTSGFRGVHIVALPRTTKLVSAIPAPQRRVPLVSSSPSAASRITRETGSSDS
jgi:hypothetical protein